MKSKVIIMLPAFNEEACVKGIVEKIIKRFPSYDVLVVNDCSQDKTEKMAFLGGAIVINHPVHMGYGVAIQTGYKYALKNNYKYLVQLDSDGQHSIEHISTLLESVMSGECDFAVGSRFMGEASYSMEPLRRIGHRLFGKIASVVLEERVSDPTSGFQAMNRRVIRFFSYDLFPCDYPDADVRIMTHFAGIKTRELPVVMYKNTTGKSIHSGWKPVYYVFKMFFSIFILLIKKRSVFQELVSDD